MPNFDNKTFAEYAIELEKDYYAVEKFTVYGYDIYPEDSVLAGQHRRCYLESYDSLEEAKKAYPMAETGCLGYPPAKVSSIPPSDFDPLFAGERWDDE